MNYSEYGNLVNNPPPPTSLRVGSIVEIDANDPVFQQIYQELKSDLSDKRWKDECAGQWIITTLVDYEWVEGYGAMENYTLKSLRIPRIDSWYKVPLTAIKIVKY